MHQMERLIVFLTLVAITCNAKIIIEESTRIDSNLVEATVQVLRSCYGNLVTPVGLAGNSAGKIGKTLWSQDDYPAVLIDADSRIVVNGSFRPIDRFRLQVFVITASSDGNLMRTLRRIKASIWWNHMADFLIVHRSPSGSDCTNTFRTLWTAWEMNILNANFMCNDPTKGLLIYTFNPYTSRAPDPWRYVRTYQGIKNHPWTLFVRRYEDTEEICEELDYKKTNDLGGYEIRVSVGDSVRRERTKFEGMCFDPIASDTCSVVFPPMNATFQIITHGSADSLGRIDDRGNVIGILGEVAKGLTDVGMNSRAPTDLGNLTASYTYFQIEMYSVSQYSGYKSQLSKISSVIDGNSRLGLLIVILITVMFFKYFVKSTTIVALMNTLRLICAEALPQMTRRTGLRIYFVSLFVFAITMHGIFQGRLASLLTKPEPLRNVNSMTDLAELDHKVYGVSAYGKFFRDPKFDKRFFPIEGNMCTNYAVRSPKAVCVAQKRVLIDEAVKYNLHLSRQVLASIHVVLPIRPDWPLEDRFNELLMRMVSGGFKNFLNKKATYSGRRHIKLQEKKYKNEGIKVLTLNQLGFAFAILGIGLGVATMSFIIEVVVDRIRRRRKRVARKIKRSNQRNK